MKGKQPLNFWREGEGSAADQPTLWQWLSHPTNVRTFAAVLGSPIQHSFSPAYHKSFFKSVDIPFYKIQIESQDFSEAFSILENLGLVAAAVTSPLKSEAGQFVGKDPLNTLWKSKNRWFGASTDRFGAKVLLQSYLSEPLVIWGGGGVLNAIKEVTSSASFYSAQTAQPRQASVEILNPRTIVWGDPHNSISKIPLNWKPETVIDLNYQDSSPGKLYAQKIKAHYVSGLAMFDAQAAEQQRLWKVVLDEKEKSN